MTATDILGTLTMADFSARVHEEFAIQVPERVVPLKLTQVTSVGKTNRAGGAFSLLFVSPAGPWLPQAIYPVTHPALGTMEIFLVPIGPTPDGNGYQAIFA